MTTLSMDPLTLTHTLITLIAIFSGLVVVAQMLKSALHGGWTGTFLATSILTSATGYLFHQSGPQPSPAQVVGAVALVVLVPTVAGLYLKHLAGAWRPIYVIGALISLWFNVFVLIIQSFIKIPPLHALVPGIPPSGPIFGATQLIVLVAFVITGWLALKRFHPLTAVAIPAV
jgi:hypothetical protein